MNKVEIRNRVDGDGNRYCSIWVWDDLVFSYGISRRVGVNTFGGVVELMRII